MNGKDWVKIVKVQPKKNEKGWAKTCKVRLKKGKDWLSKWEGQSQNTEGSTQPKKTRQQLDQNTEDLA